MKRNLKSLVVAVVILTLGVGACDDFLDINVSPNNQVDAPIGTILTSATVAVGYQAGSDAHRFSSIIAQQFAGQGNPVAQTREYMRYQILDTDVNNLWSSYYAIALADLEVVIQKAASGNAPKYSGVAKILKAYVFHQLVDQWGDVPYTEALKFTANIRPKYDASGTIYPALIALLDEGIAEVNTASPLSPRAFDTIYGSVAAASYDQAWVRAANTLKLRLLMRQTKLNPTSFAAVNTLISSGGPFIETAAQNFQHAFLATNGRQNPMQQFEAGRLNQFFPHATVVNLMNTKEDPRRARFFTPFPYTTTAPFAYAGVPANPGVESFAFSRLHVYFRGAASGTGVAGTNGAIPATGAGSITYDGSAPTRMLLASEYWFMRAEATLRYGAAGDAAAHFEAGIRQSMAAAGVTPAADIDTYVTAQVAAFNAANAADKIRLIIEEKFVSNLGVPVEAWSDWRRTGHPAITPPSNAELQISGGGVPRVYPYPLSETTTNNANVPVRANLADKRVFWDN